MSRNNNWKEYSVYEREGKPHALATLNVRNPISLLQVAHTESTSSNQSCLFHITASSGALSTLPVLHSFSALRRR